MKIVIATALYPPDIAQPAQYMKELAKRLSTNHDITVISYGRLPEKIPGVNFVSIDKRKPLPFRLSEFTLKLFRALFNADALYAENGASVELPASLVTALIWKKFILHIGDKRAHAHAGRNPFLSIIELFVFWRASQVLDEMPANKPEVLPFESASQEALDLFENSWNDHIRKINGELV